jgi:hypothetical protein
MKLSCDYYENPPKKVAIGLNGLITKRSIWPLTKVANNYDVNEGPQGGVV